VIQLSRTSPPPAIYFSFSYTRWNWVYATISDVIFIKSSHCQIVWSPSCTRASNKPELYQATTIYWHFECFLALVHYPLLTLMMIWFRSWITLLKTQQNCWIIIRNGPLPSDRRDETAVFPKLKPSWHFRFLDSIQNGDLIPYNMIWYIYVRSKADEMASLI